MHCFADNCLLSSGGDEWVSRVLHHTQHIIGHFGDKACQVADVDIFRKLCWISFGLVFIPHFISYYTLGMRVYGSALWKFLCICTADCRSLEFWLLLSYTLWKRTVLFASSLWKCDVYLHRAERWTHEQQFISWRKRQSTTWKWKPRGVCTEFILCVNNILFLLEKDIYWLRLISKVDINCVIHCLFYGSVTWPVKIVLCLFHLFCILCYVNLMSSLNFMHVRLLRVH